MNRLLFDAMRKAEGRPMAVPKIARAVVEELGHGEEPQWGMVRRVRANLQTSAVIGSWFGSMASGSGRSGASLKLDQIAAGGNECPHMQVYALIHLSDPSAIRRDLEARFPQNFKALNNNEFLFATTAATSREVSDLLGISEKIGGSGIVVALLGFWGRATSDVWEWIEAKKAQGSG